MKLAIDLGGTNVRCALIDSNYQILKKLEEKTTQAKDPEILLGQLCNMIHRVDENQQAEMLGIGVPGVVDDSGFIRYISNIPSLDGVSIKKMLENRTGLSVNVLNDGNAAALAEACLGAGKGYKSVYYITISTGIGGGYVYEGKVVTGAFGYAGEVGGILVKEFLEKDENCGRIHPACAEAVAGGDALLKRGRAAAKRMLNDGGEIFMSMERGEAWAIDLVEEMIRTLAVVFADISYVINPQIFVVGGGCMKSGTYFWEKMKEEYKKITDVGLHSTKFEKARLEDPGLLGLVV